LDLQEDNATSHARGAVHQPAGTGDATQTHTVEDEQTAAGGVQSTLAGDETDLLREVPGECSTLRVLFEDDEAKAGLAPSTLRLALSQQGVTLDKRMQIKITKIPRPVGETRGRAVYLSPRVDKALESMEIEKTRANYRFWAEQFADDAGVCRGLEEATEQEVKRMRQAIPDIEWVTVQRMKHNRVIDNWVSRNKLRRGLILLQCACNEQFSKEFIEHYFCELKYVNIDIE
jgi:hypothetical protein